MVPLVGMPLAACRLCGYAERDCGKQPPAWQQDLLARFPAAFRLIADFEKEACKAHCVLSETGNRSVPGLATVSCFFSSALTAGRSSDTVHSMTHLAMFYEMIVPADCADAYAHIVYGNDKGERIAQFARTS